MCQVVTCFGVLLSLVLLSGCVVGELQQRIRPEDTTWIQRGQTTREEVMARFGEPDRSAPKKDKMGLGEYVEYGRPLMLDTYTARGYTSPFEPRPRGGGPGPLGGAAPQVYRPPIESIEFPSPAETVQPFWLLYDTQGVVGDFGFGTPPQEPEEPET